MRIHPHALQAWVVPTFGEGGVGGWYVQKGHFNLKDYFFFLSDGLSKKERVAHGLP